MSSALYKNDFFVNYAYSLSVKKKRVRTVTSALYKDFFVNYAYFSVKKKRVRTVTSSGVPWVDVSSSSVSMHTNNVHEILVLVRTCRASIYW